MRTLGGRRWDMYAVEEYCTKVIAVRHRCAMAGFRNYWNSNGHYQFVNKLFDV
jgi:hypothetical protein